MFLIAYPDRKCPFTKAGGFARVPLGVLGATHMDTLLERLQELEIKVREALGELAQSRGEREVLLAKLQALQNDLQSRDQETATLRAEREREAAEVARLRAEREEVRTKVEGLLAEIARLESTVQGATT
jgi:predicted nuclease with TOPRIM domain